MIRGRIKLGILGALRGAGVFRLVAGSSWRRQRLLILCYHGTSLNDEHSWRPSLYIEPQKLEERLSFLKQNQYSVLPLGQALHQLQSGTLTPRSVVLTFDDGTYDFYGKAFPLLQRYGFPATVYLTTYYVLTERPVFNLICSYMLWKRRGTGISHGTALEIDGPIDLHTEAERHKVVRRLIEMAERQNMTGLQKDDLAERLASLLGIDYAELKAKRILQLMNAQEVRKVAHSGIDIQLHTHRHRTPENEMLFRREIQENRARVCELTGCDSVHFCYPGGVYTPAFLPWLKEEKIISATTCDVGLVTSQSETLLLPRFVDNQTRTQIEFESWTAGIGDMMAFRRNSLQTYVPGE